MALPTPVLHYEKPPWSTPPTVPPRFDLLKAGVLLDTISCPQAHYIVAGRLPLCHLELEHPSVSRYHAVIQFKGDGETFLYDLQSSHGTRLNKKLIPPHTYVPIRTGDQLRFGESSRIFVFLGSDGERESESEGKKGSDEDDTGITWGFREDAIEEEEQEFDPANYIPDENAYYRKDPKKAFRNYMESKGLDTEFEWEEDGPGHARVYTARIRLPLDTALGPIYASASSGKKRDAERLAALDACEKLDARGMLKTNADVESAMRKVKLKEMYGDDDSDEDSFYDRTDRAEKQKIQKVLKSGTSAAKTETYDSLVAKSLVLAPKIKELRERIESADEQETPENRKGDEDDLDSYIDRINTTSKEVSKSSLQKELQLLLKEEQRLNKLIQIAKPADIFSTPMVSVNRQTAPADVSKMEDNTSILQVSQDNTIDNHLDQPSNIISTDELVITNTAPITDTSLATDIDGFDGMPPPPIPAKKMSTVVAIAQEKNFIEKQQTVGEQQPLKRRSRPMVPMTLEEHLQQVEGEQTVDTWVPPEEQTGDGKTSLNAKFGY